MRLQHEQAQGADCRVSRTSFEQQEVAQAFDIFSELMRSMPECIQ